MAELFQAGAAAVGVGTELISKDALDRRDYAAIGAVAKRFLAAVREARGGWADGQMGRPSGRVTP
jgi:2-keto-3-deoxy-6-phosphogluconate aldolase